MKTHNKGFALLPLLAIIALLLAGGGAYVYVHNNRASKSVSESPMTLATSTNDKGANGEDHTGSGNSMRKSSFTASPSSGSAPAVVTFSFVSLDTDASANRFYEVDFGDNSNITGDTQETRCAGECRRFTVTHTYTLPGTYTAKLVESIEGARFGGKYIGTATITVTDSNLQASNPNMIADGKLIQIDHFYSKDQNHVYFLYRPERSSILAGADPATFQKINQYWAKDKNSVYTNGEKVSGVDIQTFQIIANSPFAKDKNNVFFPAYIDQGRIKFDAQTFEVLNEMYLKDKNQIVYVDRAGGATELELITQADANTFQSVGSGYGKDANHVYFENNIIMQADPATFKLAGSSDNGKVQDKNNSYICFDGAVDGRGCNITNLKTGENSSISF